jgi:hypothetical protein
LLENAFRVTNCTAIIELTLHILITAGASQSRLIGSEVGKTALLALLFRSKKCLAERAPDLLLFKTNV